jgi:hypothetical protein
MGRSNEINQSRQWVFVYLSVGNGKTIGEFNHKIPPKLGFRDT